MAITAMVSLLLGLLFFGVQVNALNRQPASPSPQLSARAASRLVRRDAATLQPAKRQDMQPPTPCHNACCTIVDAYLYNGTLNFPARQALECLRSVPFYPADAKPLLKYYRETLEFQSTLAYLKSPPDAYQQPGVDLLSGIDLIRNQVDSAVFDNQFSFESALQRLAYSAHDGNLLFAGGASAVFDFGSPFLVKSVSIDGKALPKPYLLSDLQQYRASGVRPSAIKTINDESAVDYLQNYARLYAQGNVEPHADWNSAMESPALDVQGYYSTFDASNPFYPGDQLRATLENGTEVEPMDFVAAANFFNYDLFDRITDGQAFYDFFVRAIPQPDEANEDPAAPATSSTAGSSSPTSTSSGADDAATPTDDPSSPFGNRDPPPRNWYEATNFTGYPNDPDVIQPRLGTTGFVTGYLLRDASVGVISIPSFSAFGEDLVAFSDTVGAFLNRSQSEGMKKIVVDLQGNLGGDNLLAIDTFRRFFPNVDPFAGSRLRSSAMADALGTTYTQYFQKFLDNPAYGNQTYREALIDLPWAPQNYINVNTGKTFGSWPEFFGPHPDRQDSFSTIKRDDLNNAVFDILATEEDSEDDSPTGLIVYGYANRTASPKEPQFKADDIVLLADGLCGFSCSIFAEAMKQAGVKSVVVGGQPKLGPMQAVSGTRGVRVFDSSELDTEIYVATLVNQTLETILPQDRLQLNFSLLQATVNLEDQVRQKGDFPLQFAYEPADCRILYTLENHDQFDVLWRNAADAIWKDQSLCVAKSTGWVRSGTDMYGPSKADRDSWKINEPAPPAVPMMTRDLIELPDDETLLVAENGTHKLEGRAPLGSRAAPRKATALGPTANGCSQCSGSQRCLILSRCRRIGGSFRYVTDVQPSCVDGCSGGRNDKSCRGSCGVNDLEVFGSRLESSPQPICRTQSVSTECNKPDLIDMAVKEAQSQARKNNMADVRKVTNVYIIR